MINMAIALIISAQLALPIRSLLPLAMGGPSRRPPRAKIRRASVAYPLMPCDWVQCKLSGFIMAQRCVEMQEKTWPTGNRKGAPMKHACQGCAQGAEHAKRIAQTSKPRRPRTVPVLMPCESVPCKLGGVIMVRACLEMRSKRWPSGNRKGALCKKACQGCEMGQSYAERSPWFVPEKPTQRAEVLPPSQRKAKDRWVKEHLIDRDDQPWMDPLKEAAMLSPDDDGTDY